MQRMNRADYWSPIGRWIAHWENRYKPTGKKTVCFGCERFAGFATLSSAASKSVNGAWFMLLISREPVCGAVTVHADPRSILRSHSMCSPEIKVEVNGSAPKSAQGFPVRLIASFVFLLFSFLTIFGGVPLQSGSLSLLHLWWPTPGASYRHGIKQRNSLR